MNSSLLASVSWTNFRKQSDIIRLDRADQIGHVVLQRIMERARIFTAMSIRTISGRSSYRSPDTPRTVDFIL